MYKKTLVLQTKKTSQKTWQDMLRKIHPVTERSIEDVDSDGYMMRQYARLYLYPVKSPGAHDVAGKEV